MIVVEANEISKEVFEWYGKRSNGSISKSLSHIITTELDDMPEEYLYPSQAWASISTSLPSSLHKIRWYNDSSKDSKFYWRELSQKGKKVMIMGSLHTGSISEEEKLNYDFVFPDFFHKTPIVTNNKYRSFQEFNHDISVMSGRKTSLVNVLINASKSFIKYPFLSAWGVSIKDFGVLFSSILNSRKDPEILRNIQFLLQSRIFINEIKKGNGSDLSIIFTNHVASCLHRNYIDFTSESLNEEEKVKKRNIYNAMKMLDNFINEISSVENREILIITALGQRLNKNISAQYKQKNLYDYKLIDKTKFLSFFIKNKNKNNNINFLPEMIPQYTFEFSNEDLINKFISETKKIGSDPNAIRFGYYVPQGRVSESNKGLFLHIDKNGKKVTCTTTVRPDKDGFIHLNKRKVHFEELGFTKFKVADFHHGEHTRFGCLIPIKNKLSEKKIHFSKIVKFIKEKI